MTPINENITTIIGERSPVNNYNGINDNIGDFPKSSRQSFEKQNKLASLASMTYQPTIISLSSPVKTKSESWEVNRIIRLHNSIGGISDNHKHLNMFEPPRYLENQSLSHPWREINLPLLAILKIVLVLQVVETQILLNILGMDYQELLVLHQV